MGKKYYDENGKEVSLKQRGGCFKWVGIGFVCILAAGIIATALEVDDGSSPESPNEEVTANELIQETSVFRIGDTITTKNFEITINGKEILSEVSDSTGYLKYSADGVYLVLDVSYKNISDKMETLDNSSFQITSGDSNYSPSSLLANDDDIFHDRLNPGIDKTGKIFFDIPENVATSEGLTLKISSSIFSNSGSATIDLN